MQKSVCFAATLLLCWTVGCGGSGEPEIALVPVSGTVLADGQPLVNAMVTFAPYGEGQGRPAYGVTDSSGKYELKFVDGRPGCPVGKFRVSISKFAQADGSPFPAGMPAEEQTAVGKEHIPAKYSSYDKTELWTEVTGDGGSIPFEIKLK